MDKEKKDSKIILYYSMGFALLLCSLVFFVLFIVFYDYFNPDLFQNFYPSFSLPIPLQIRGKITGSSFILMMTFFFPGLILFIYGLIKNARTKDVTLGPSMKQAIRFQITKEQKYTVLKFLGFVAFFGILMIIPVIVGASVQAVMEGIVRFLSSNFTNHLGIMLGVFFISTFGNFTVIFPFPYTFVLVLLGTYFTPIFDPITFFWYATLMGVCAGFGAAIGETSAWLLGRSQTSSLEDSESGQKFLSLKKKIDKGYGGLLVFIYAATPLPDDVLLIALGSTRYKLWKVLIWCFLGKVILCLLSVYAGAIPIIAFIVGGGPPVAPTNFSEVISSAFVPTLFLVLGLIVIFLIIYVPWGKIFGSYKEKREEKKKQEEIIFDPDVLKGSE